MVEVLICVGTRKWTHFLLLLRMQDRNWVYCLKNKFLAWSYSKECWYEYVLDNKVKIYRNNEWVMYMWWSCNETLVNNVNCKWLQTMVLTCWLVILITKYLWMIWIVGGHKQCLLTCYFRKSCGVKFWMHTNQIMRWLLWKRKHFWNLFVARRNHSKWFHWPRRCGF